MRFLFNSMVMCPKQHFTLRTMSMVMWSYIGIAILRSNIIFIVLTYRSSDLRIVILLTQAVTCFYQMIKSLKD